MRTQMKRIVAMMLVAMMTLTMMPTSVLAETSSSCEGIVHKKSQVDKYVSFSTIALDYGSSGGNYVEDYNNEVCVGATIGVNFFCQKDIPFYLDYIDGEYPSSSPWEPASYTTGDDYSWSRKFTSTSVGSTPPVTINLHVQCNDCGVAEVYSYTPDVAVMECTQKHSSSSKQGEPSYKMIENDSVNHTVVQNYTITCYLCGKTTNKAEESTATHVFDATGMCECGYQETTELVAPTVEILTKDLTTELSGGGVCLSLITWDEGTVGLEMKAIHTAPSGLTYELPYDDFYCGSYKSIEVETTGIKWPGTETMQARTFAFDSNGQKIYSEWASASTTITGECQHEGQICTKEVAGDYWGLYGIEDVDPYYTLSEDGNQHQLHTKCIELCKICCGLLNDNVDVTDAYENHVYENGLCVCGHQEYVDNSIPTIDGLTVTPEEIALGESIAVSGTVNGNGGTVARVRVSVFYNEALTDGKIYNDYEVNSASFDLSNVGSIIAGETLAQDGSVLIPAEGTYWLAVFATNTNGNGQGESPVLKQFTVKNKETPTHKFAAPTWISGDKTVQISGFSAMLGGNEVNLKWNAVEGAPYYQITATFIGSCGDTLDVDDPVSELYEGTITSGDFVCSLGHPGTFYIYIYVCDAEGNRLSDASTPLTITAKGTCSHSTEYYEYARYELDSERGAAALEQMGNVDTSDKYTKIDEMSHTHEVPYILLCQICLKPMKIAYDSFTEEHTYQNGKCACGHEQITDTSIPTIENLMVSPSQAAIGDTLTVSGSVNGNGGTIARVRVSVFYNEALTDGKVYKDYDVNSSAFDLAAVNSIIAGQTLAQDGSVLIPTEGTYWLAVFATNTNGNGQGESPELYKLTITSTTLCDHSGRNYEYILDTSIPVQYVDTGDGANHYLINSYSCICKDCGGFVGTVIDEYLKAETAPHSYDVNGVCVCGAITTTPPTGPVQLATPVLTLTGLDSLYEGDTTGVVWNKVSNATLYALYVWNDSNVVDYVEYTADAKLEYSHTFDKAGTYVIGVYACAPGSTDYLQSEVGSVNVIVSEIPTGPALKWDVHMKKGSTSTILLDRTQGSLNPAYTYRVRVYDGDKQIREVDLKSSYHSYNDLKLPRNETYRFEVLEQNTNGISVGYDAGIVTIPLYTKVWNVVANSDMIKFQWDGSYGVDKTIVAVTVNGNTVFNKFYPNSGDDTVTIDGSWYEDYLLNGDATVKIFVQPAADRFSTSAKAQWTGTIKQLPASVPSWQNVWNHIDKNEDVIEYMLHPDPTYKFEAFVETYRDSTYEQAWTAGLSSIEIAQDALPELVKLIELNAEDFFDLFNGDAKVAQLIIDYLYANDFSAIYESIEGAETVNDVYEILQTEPVSDAIDLLIVQNMDVRSVTTGKSFKLGDLMNITENNYKDIYDNIEALRESGNRFDLSDLAFVQDVYVDTPSKLGNKVQEKLGKRIIEEHGDDTFEAQIPGSTAKKVLKGAEVFTYILQPILSGVGTYNEYLKYEAVLNQYEQQLTQILDGAGHKDTEAIVGKVMDTLTDAVADGIVLTIEKELFADVGAATIELIVDVSCIPLAVLDVETMILGMAANTSETFGKVWSVEDLYEEFQQAEANLLEAVQEFHRNPSDATYEKLKANHAYYALLVGSGANAVSNILINDAESGLYKFKNWISGLFDGSDVDQRLAQIEYAEEIPSMDDQELQRVTERIFP